MHRNMLRLIACLAALPASLHAQQSADHILVVKSTHTMTLYAHGQPIKTYHVWIGRGPGDTKQQQGDNRTPEGSYTINGRNAHSSAHLSLHISYPTPPTANEPVNAASIPAATS